MELDIVVFIEVKEVDGEGIYQACNAIGFEDRCIMFEGPVYGELASTFCVGSYKDFYNYRQALAGLTGTTVEEVWLYPEECEDEPFFEQLMFTDRNGTFDYIASEVLYQAYNVNKAWAKFKLSKANYALYCQFHDAFKLAYVGQGIVAYI